MTKVRIRFWWKCTPHRSQQIGTFDVEVEDTLLVEADYHIEKVMEEILSDAMINGLVKTNTVIGDFKFIKYSKFFKGLPSHKLK